jgi:UDP-N-acetylenolpyruvoylglucosamine reductase
VFSRKTIVVFQPHRYSRTLSLKGELAAELSRFDYVYLLEVYEASEDPIEGGSGRDLYDACKNCFEHCEFHSDEDALLCTLESKIVGSNLLNVVFLGAGKTDILARQFVQNLFAKDLRWGSLYSEISSVLDYGSKIRSQEPLSNKTTLRLGGTAELYFEPASGPELATALRVCHESGIPVYPLGRGSNLIVPDSGVSGLVIRLSHPHWRRFEVLSEGEIRVGAGMRIKELCGIACREGLEGFEFLEGIPGSVGGALRMNAGAMGGWMFDVVKSVRFVNLDGTLVEANVKELSVGYRHCRELERAIALDAILVASAVGQKEVELRKAIDVYQSKRKESQPREPSAGCIFKNPEGASAGQLIDELGLKGSAIGGAEISPVHGNFIVNRGGATSEDVIELVRLVIRVAKSRRSIDLEPEALLYGSEWKDVLS